jgi:hypothetical protein
VPFVAVALWHPVWSSCRKTAMNGNRLYTIIVICYTLGFLGFFIPVYGTAPLLWYAMLLVGTVLFGLRIARGDD